MGFPSGIGAIDLMVGFPSSDRQQVYKFLQPHIRDAASADLKMPAAYMFNDVPPELEDGVDPVAVVLMFNFRFPPANLSGGVVNSPPR